MPPSSRPEVVMAGGAARSLTGSVSPEGKRTCNDDHCNCLPPQRRVGRPSRDVGNSLAGVLVTTAAGPNISLSAKWRTAIGSSRQVEQLAFESISRLPHTHGSTGTNQSGVVAGTESSVRPPTWQFRCSRSWLKSTVSSCVGLLGRSIHVPAHKAGWAMINTWLKHLITASTNVAAGDASDHRLQGKNPEKTAMWQRFCARFSLLLEFPRPARGILQASP